MKIEICDDCVYIDGVAHALLENNQGADRVRQRLLIGDPIQAAAAPAPAPEPAPEPAAEPAPEPESAAEEASDEG